MIGAASHSLKLWTLAVLVVSGVMFASPALAQGKDTISNEALQAAQSCAENINAEGCQPESSSLDDGICLGQCDENGNLVDDEGNVIGESFWVDATCAASEKDEFGNCPFLAPSLQGSTQAVGNELVLTTLGYLKWFAGIAGVGGFILVAIQMMIGRRNRSQAAASALGALPWIVVGLVLVGMSSLVAEWVLELSRTQ